MRQRACQNGNSTPYSTPIKWLLAEHWVHKQQNHTLFSDAQLFKLREERLGFARLTLAMRGRCVHNWHHGVVPTPTTTGPQR